jgi:2-polyprenyl-3-methyl-5-hydroxy-6-metoxy-1,4-benzoquinol methylase
MSIKMKTRPPTSYNIASHIFRVLLNEIEFHKRSERYLTKEETKALCRYYSNWIRRSEYCEHYFAQRIKKVVEILINSNTQLSVLDCGCGFGSESIAFGLLGAKVVGVDVSIERVNVALKRLRYYREYYKKVDVSFENMNILDYAYDELFDVAYAKEFITHVCPLSKFLEVVVKALKDGGYFILSDANPFNPIVYYNAWKTHKASLYTTVIDPKTGKNIPYAVERLIPSSYLKSLLQAYNFEILSEKFFGVPYVASSLIPVIGLIEDKFNLPFLALYEIVARKKHI